MKKAFGPFALSVVLSVLYFAMGVMPVVSAVEFHVCPKKGDDSFSGSLEKPFATLQRAQRAVRDLKKAGPLAEPVFVTIHGGVFRLTEKMVFTSEDSGTQTCHVVWQAAKDTAPVVSGGMPVTNWKKHSDRIFVADVPWATDSYYPGELFVGGNRAVPARTPNEGAYFFTKKLLKSEGADGPCYGLRYEKNDIGDWIGDPDLRIVLYQHWSNSVNRVKSVDRTKNAILFDRTIARHLPAMVTRYYTQNYLAALDAPGEWYFSAKERKLYYYPRENEDLSKTEAVAACVETCLFEMAGDWKSGKPAEYIGFQGLSFEHTRPNLAADYPHSVQGANTQRGALFARGMVHCSVEQCTFAHLGEHGITLWEGCRHNVIRQCHVYDLGGGGIYLSEAAPKETSDAFMTSYNTVDNNFIHDGGYRFAAACGVFMAGSANYNCVTHNEICNMDYTGIHAGWSWSGTNKAYTHHNEFGWNHVHQIGNGVMSDLGGVYFLGVSTGTVFHDNHLHHISRYRRGSEGYGGWGVYFDAGSSNIRVENNIVHDTYDGGLHLHCYAFPRGDVIANNIFAFAEHGELMRNAAMEPDTGVHAKLFHNIVYETTPELYYGGNWKKDSKFASDYNCLWSTADKPVRCGGRSLEAWQKEGYDTHSVFKDPRFVDAGKRDFTLRADSPAPALGFVPIDTARIGLYGDESWTNLPKSVPLRHVAVFEAPQSVDIEDRFEEYAPGEKPDYVSVFEEKDKGGTVGVVAGEGVGGGQCVKFVDAPGMKWAHDPHMYYNLNIGKGTVSARFRMRFEANAILTCELRDYTVGTYVAGPTFNVSRSGDLNVGGKKLATLPRDTWIEFEVVCGTGPQAVGTWTLNVTLPDKPCQTYANLACDKSFKTLTWLGYISGATERTVFYLDDVSIKTKDASHKSAGK